MSKGNKGREFFVHVRGNWADRKTWKWEFSTDEKIIEFWDDLHLVEKAAFEKCQASLDSEFNRRTKLSEKCGMQELEIEALEQRLAEAEKDKHEAKLNNERLKKQLAEREIEIEEYKGLSKVSGENRQLAMKLKKQLAVAVVALRKARGALIAYGSPKYVAIIREALKQIEEMEK